MPEKTILVFCENCDNEYKIKYEGLDEIQFCSFCGEEIGLDEDDEFEEDVVDEDDEEY